MQEYIPILISVVCAVAILALISAMIFNATFRDAMLGGSGDVKVAGILTVQGVAIVLLCALFLAGLVYPLSKTSDLKRDLSQAASINDQAPLPSKSQVPKRYSFKVGLQKPDDLDVHLFRVENGSPFNVEITPYDVGGLYIPLKMELWDAAGELPCGDAGWNGIQKITFNCKANLDHSSLSIVFRPKSSAQLNNISFNEKLDLVKVEISALSP